MCFFSCLIKQGPEVGLVGSWGGLRNFTGLNCLATGLCEPMGICDWVGRRSRIRGQPKTVTSLPERQSERAAGCWLTLCKYLVGHPGHPSSDTISGNHQMKISPDGSAK